MKANLPTIDVYQNLIPRHSSLNSPSLCKGQMSEPSQSYNPPQNMGTMRQQQEQSDPLNRFRTRHRSTSPSNTPLPRHEIAPKFRTLTALHFEEGIPTRLANPPAFAYPPPSAQQSMTVKTPNNQRTASSPPQHPSPICIHTLHQTNESSCASNSPLATLPSLSRVPYRPPMYRGVDQSPNHQHVDIVSSPDTQTRPLTTQLPRDKTEQQVPIRRHTLNSDQVLNQQIGSSTDEKQRTTSLSLPLPIYAVQPHSPLLRLGTQQASPQPGQINVTSKPCSIPPPFTVPRHYNPPDSAISSTSLPPPPPQPQPMSQPPQPPQPSQIPSPQSPCQIADETSSILANTSLTETVDKALALEPLRSCFENVLTQTVQNVHQVISKMQKAFTQLVSAERRKNSYLMRCLVNSSEKLKGQERAMEGLKKENDSFKEKAVENGQLKMENTQKLMVIDTLNHENGFLRRENNELRKKNDEVKEALTKAAVFAFQYKEELDKLRADIDTLRKSREATMLSPQMTAASSDPHHREMTRLHAERGRERIVNDAVKKIRALTAQEDSPRSNPQHPDTTRECDSETAVAAETSWILSDVVDRDRERRTQSSLLEVSTSKQNQSSPSVVAKVHDIIAEHLGPSTPPPPTEVSSTDKGEESSKVEVDEPDSREIVDVDMNDDDNITVVPPITSIRAVTNLPNPVVKIDAEQLGNDLQKFDQQMQPTDDFIAESKPQLLDLETQRQRRRQARRDPAPSSPVSSSQARSRKTWPVTSSSTGMKRSRDEYEGGQEADVTIEEPEERTREKIVCSPSLVERNAIHVDLENSEVGKIIMDREKRDVNISIKISEDKTRRKGGNVATDGTQVPPQIEMQMLNTPSYNQRLVKDVHPKALGRWSYCTHDSNAGGIAQQSTSLSPSPQDQGLPKRHPKFWINHMELLYETEKEVMTCRFCLSLEQNPDTTAAKRRKAKANTKKFPLNTSWADLINHCQTEHTKAYEDMEKLSPSQIAEMKRRMSPVTSTR